MMDEQVKIDLKIIEAISEAIALFIIYRLQAGEILREQVWN